MKKWYKAVLSDAGDILFTTNFSTQKQVLLDLLLQNGIVLSMEDMYRQFRPFKILSQTTMSERDAINFFFKSLKVPLTYREYSLSMNEQSAEECTLEGNITETLEQIHLRGIPFVILTDTTKKGRHLDPLLEKAIIQQLIKRGVYNPETFSLHDYVSAYITSKDLGVKKPNPKFFEKGLALSEGSSCDRAIYIAHDLDEIIGAADFGLDVMAFNFQKQNDSKEIYSEINKYNQKAKLTNHIYIADRFDSILNLL